MPIKPENRDRYPKNWKAIRARILERAGHRCELCQAPNHELIVRGRGGDAGTYMRPEGEVHDENTGQYLGRARGSEYCWDRMVKVVLTIMHLDHTPENCADDNLKAACQQCHLRYDKHHHAANAARTRAARKATGDLFERAA